MPAIRLAPRTTDFETPALGDTSFVDFASTLVYDSLYHSPVGTLGIGDGPKGGIYRFSEAMQEKKYGTGAIIEPEEANKVYGLEGELTFKEPVYETYAQLLHDRKLAEIRRDYELSSGTYNHWGRRITGFGVSMASTILDPVNLASMFVPIVGESRLLSGASRARSIFSKGLISPKTLARGVGTSPASYRLAKGAIEGVVGAGLVEPFNLIPAIQEQADYGYKDSLLNLLFGGAIGGTIYTVGGYIGDKFKSLRQGLQNVDPQTHEAATMAAVSDLAQNNPVTSPADVVSVDSSVVKVDLEQVNVQNLILIAQEHLDRLEQLYLQGRITPQQDIRRKLIGAMLRNPTAATPENLAAMFELKLNNEMERMPSGYSFVKPEDSVKVPDKAKIPDNPVPFDEAKFDQVIQKIESIANENSAAEFVPDPDNRKAFKTIVKKLLTKGYDLWNAEVRAGGESVVFLTENKAIKIAMENFKTVKGISLTPEYKTKSGPFYVRVVDRVNQLPDIDTPAIRDAFLALAERYGLAADDFGNYNLGVKDGKLVVLDEGAMSKIDRMRKVNTSTLSPEAQAVYQSLIRQIEEAKAKEKQHTKDKLDEMIKRSQQKKPEVTKVPSDKAVGLPDPVKKEAEPIPPTLSPEEKAAEQKMLADMQEQSDEMQAKDEELAALQEELGEDQPEELSKIKKIQEGLVNWANKVIKEQNTKMSLNVDPRILAAAIIRGADLLYKGVEDVAEWSKVLVAEFGDWIKDHVSTLHKSFFIEDAPDEVDIPAKLYQKGKQGAKDLTEEYHRAYTKSATRKQIKDRIDDIVNDPFIDDIIVSRFKEKLNRAEALRIVKGTRGISTGGSTVTGGWNIVDRSGHVVFYGFSTKKDALNRLSEYLVNTRRNIEFAINPTAETGPVGWSSTDNSSAGWARMDGPWKRKWLYGLLSGKYVSEKLQNKLWDRYPDLKPLAQTLYDPKRSRGGNNMGGNRATQIDTAKEFAIKHMVEELDMDTAGARQILDDWKNERVDMYHQDAALAFFIDQNVEGIGGQFKSLQYLEAQLADPEFTYKIEQKFKEKLAKVIEEQNDDGRTFDDIINMSTDDMIGWIKDNTGRDMSKDLQKMIDNKIKNQIPGTHYDLVMAQVERQIAIAAADQEAKLIKQITPAIENGVSCILRKMI
jgi:hypothetical protein